MRNLSLYPPTSQKFTCRKGSALLAVVLVLSVISSFMAVSVAKISQASQNSIGSSKVALQAQQYAASKAELVKAEKYSDLTAQTKSIISNSNTFYDEVIIGDETDYPDNDKIKQKDVTINVYSNSETLPRASLKFTRYSVSNGTSGTSVPQGTILPWYGKFSDIPEGFALCDGTKGTPDLRNRFLVGAGNNYALGDMGGEDQVTLTGTQIGNHYHYWSGMYSTKAQGFAEFKRSGLKLVKFGYDSNISSLFDAPFPTGNKMTLVFTNNPNSVDTSGVNLSARLISVSDFSSEKMEYITSLAVGTDAQEPHENRPPYYALYYIMKV